MDEGVDVLQLGLRMAVRRQPFNERDPSLSWARAARQYDDLMSDLGERADERATD